MSTPRERRWFRFSLRTLLIVVSLCGVILWAFILRRDIAAAHEAWKTAANGFDADVVPIEDLHAASMELRSAESRIPFNSHAAGVGHLARMQRYEIHYLVHARMSESMRYLDDLPKVHDYVREAEQWLKAN